MHKPIEMKVSASSNPGSVAGAIAATFRDLKGANEDLSQHRVLLVAIGAAAVNQAVKACAIAKSYVAASNMRLSFDLGFRDMIVDEQERTGIEFAVSARIG